MRLFIGVRIPDEISERTGEVSRRLESKIREARVVAPVNLHITLRFLGEVSEGRIPVISGILENIAKNYAPFRAEVKGAGVFPDQKNPRVFWIGANSAGRLKKLNVLIEDGLEPEGFVKEKRFKEHITIARFRATPKAAFLEEIIERYGEESFGVMEIRAIELIKSDLSPSGPVYTAICTIQLGKNVVF